MAAYGTLIAWARAMGHEEAADLLEENLDEEKAADTKLSSLAEGGINEAAAEIAQADDETADAGESSSTKSGTKKAKSRR